MSLEIRRAAPKEVSAVRRFYADRQYGGQIQPHDALLLALRDGELLGAVRLAPEHGTTVLRGMQVHPSHQRQGIGRQLLAAVAQELGSTACYCIPYAHLIGFYSSIGFDALDLHQAPDFLAERLIGYRARGDGRHYLLMFRPDRIYGTEHLHAGGRVGA
jgi:GNAT superfamily N-acetyltransferase